MNYDIALVHATRGRPDRAVEIRNLWFMRADRPERIEYWYGVDDDDPETLAAIQNSPSMSHKCFKTDVVFNPSGKGVFAAWNACAKVSTGKLIIPVEDDLLCQPHWDTECLNAMGEDLDEVATLSICDGHNAQIECGITRALFESRGWFSEAYFGLFGDSEFRARVRQDKVLNVAAPHILFEHRDIGDRKDATYARKQARFFQEQRLFEQRMKAGWPD